MVVMVQVVVMQLSTKSWGDNGDGGGDRDVGAEAYSTMSASADAVIGGWGLTVFRALQRRVLKKGTLVLGDLGGGGVGADSSVSNDFVSLAEGTWSIASHVVESAGARCSSSSSSSSEASSTSSSS
ncbi:hypothetical protein Tco_1115121 [Tanacetum coccineum]